MREFKVIKQSSVSTELDNRGVSVVEFSVIAESYKFNRDEMVITEFNIHSANEYLDSSYQIGDIHYSPLKSISFYSSNMETEVVNVFADPYYKLMELVGTDWVLLDRHKCGK